MFIRPFTLLRDGNPESAGSGGGAATTTTIPAEPASAPGFNPFDTTPTAAPAPIATTPVATVTAPALVAPVAATPTAPAAVAPVVPTAPAPVTLQPDQLQQLIAAARGPSVNGQPPATPPMSTEDFKRAFNVFEATPETYEAILGVKPDSPARLQALNDALQAVSRQSVTIMRHLMGKELTGLQEKFQGQIAPVAQSFQAQNEEKLKTDFLTTYPGLKDWTPAIRAVVDAVRSRGLKFNTPQEGMEHVAAETARVLGKDLTWAKTALAGPSAQAPSQQPVTRQMSTMSMGGRSGTSGSATPVSTAERLFAGQT